MAWNYDPNQYDPEGGNYELVPEGEHKIRIDSVKATIAGSGRDMWKIKFSVSGIKSKLFYNLVFMDDQPEITNQNLGLLFDSFGIQPGNMDYETWIGHIGACRVAHELYQNKLRANISYFLTRAKQAELGMLNAAAPAQPAPAPRPAPAATAPYPF